MTDPALGPYMNEDGDWWVPATVPFREARALVVGCLGDVPRLAYLGKSMAWLDSAHEGGCGDECKTRVRQLAYHFEERGVL